MGGFPPLCLKGKLCMMLVGSHGLDYLSNAKDGYKMTLHFTVLSCFNYYGQSNSLMFSFDVSGLDFLRKWLYKWGFNIINISNSCSNSTSSSISSTAHTHSCKY